MALRLMEITIPVENVDYLLKLLKEQDTLGIWEDILEDSQCMVRVLLELENTESVTEVLNKHYRLTDGFRMVLLKVEGTLPMPEEPGEKEEEKVDEEKKRRKEAKVGLDRISLEEIHTEITQSAKLSPLYIITVIISTLVAAIGLIKDSVAIIIGAMVIAPLLGPNVALALAATLGDIKLAIRSLKAGISGFFVAMAVSVLVGVIFRIDPGVREISSRTDLSEGDFVLALVAGCAAGLAHTTGISTPLIGVMVAVALLPPLVTSGLLIGDGLYERAFGAFLLFITNVVCLNLACILTFVLQGVKPRSWWEASKARKAQTHAVGFWIFLLVVLVVVVWLWHRN